MKKTIRFLMTALLFFLTCSGAAAAAEEEEITTVTPGILSMTTEATFPPYEYYDGNEIVGIDVEVAQAIAEKLGLTLQITDIAFDSIIPGVQTFKYDMGMAGMTVSEERLEEVNFSESYAKGIQVVIVREDSPIQSIDDLFAEGANNIIGTQSGTTGFLYATWDIEDAGLGTVRGFGKTTDALEALKNGQVDCILLDNEPAKALAAGSSGVKILDAPYVEEEYAICIAKENTALLDAVNEALRQLKADGTLDAIMDKYINDEADTQTQQETTKSWIENVKEDFVTCFLVKDRWTYITTGLLNTLKIAFAATFLGIAIGSLVAVIRSTHDRNIKTMRRGIARVLLIIGNWFCKLYLTVIRGTPVMIQILIMFFVVFSTARDGVPVAMLTFGINSGAYVAEIIRAGIMAVDNGQMEAGRSLGFNFVQTMWYIIIPQAFKSVLPSLANEFIVLLKETSVACYVAVNDLTKGGEIIRSTTYIQAMPLLIVAGIYLLMVIFFSEMVSRLERRLRSNER
ncbi:MAG: ABC transporter permease subunit [Solobacterium sp.]|nr:ABC transporter permease subunit [Solobacterium sp.]